MKIKDSSIVDKSIGFNTDHPFATDGSMGFKAVLEPELEKLGTEGNTVIITDSYLFNPGANQNDYCSDLKELLKNLKAKEIIHSGYTPRDSTVLNDVMSFLNNKGCTLLINDVTPAYHGRYWICVETKKGITVDVSLNGFQTKRGYVHETPIDEIESVLNVFGFQDGDVNE